MKLIADANKNLQNTDLSSWRSCTNDSNRKLLHLLKSYPNLTHKDLNKITSYQRYYMSASNTAPRRRKAYECKDAESQAPTSGTHIETSQSEKRLQNLARIRDNQRRSRARRKDELTRLEIGIRQFEADRLEMNKSVQSAINTVNEENKRLGQVLCQHGFNANSVDCLVDYPKTYYIAQDAFPRLVKDHHILQKINTRTQNERYRETSSASADLNSLTNTDLQMPVTPFLVPYGIMSRGGDYEIQELMSVDAFLDEPLIADYNHTRPNGCSALQ